MKKLFFIFMLAGLTCRIFAQTFPDTSFVFEALALHQDFTVDGNLDKAVWKQARPIGQLLTIEKKKFSFQSDMRLLYSSTALYLGCRLDQDMSKITANWDQNDCAIWNDDCVELFLDVPGKNGAFYQFLFNSLGHYADFKDQKVRYNAKGIKVATVRKKDHWTLEVMLPFADLNMPRPFVGDFISMRIHRSVHNPSAEGAALPNLLTYGNNRRCRLGKLLFTSGTESALAMQVSRKNFSLGCNQTAVTLKNNYPENFSGKLQVLLRNSNKSTRTMEEIPLNLKSGESLEKEFRINVSELNTDKLIFLVTSGKQEEIARVLRGDFPPCTLNTAQMLQDNRIMLGAMEHLRGIDHPIYRGAINSVERMNKALLEFNRQIQEAEAQGKTVPGAVISSLLDMTNRFQKFVNQYRYLVWKTDPWSNGSPDELAPKAFNLRPILQFEQAGNEREAVCLAISGLLCSSALELRVVPQSYDGDKMNFISCDKFEIYQEKFINHTGDILSVPLIQSAGNYITVTPGRVNRIWVVFNSRNVRPGNYTTSILLKPAYDYSVPERSIPVGLKIWDYALPETHDWPMQSFMWGPNYFTNDEVALLRLCHSYHMTHAWSKGFNYIQGFYADAYRRPLPKGKRFLPELARTANEEFLQEALKLKMKFVLGWNLPLDIEFYKIMAERFLKMGFAKKDFIFKALVPDEFNKEEAIRQKDIVVRDAVRKLNPGWFFQAVYLSIPPPTGATLEDIEKAGLGDFFKVWTVIDGMLRDKKRGPKVIDYLHGKGDQVWSYTCARYMQTRSVLDYYRFYAWSCYMRGLDGMAMWTIMSPAGDDGFDHRDGYDDGVCLRGVNKKPVPTKRLEAIREGLEDVAYMDRLQKELKKAAAAGRKYPRWQKLLDDRSGIMKRSVQAEVDAWRLQAGRAIQDLIQNSK